MAKLNCEIHNHSEILYVCQSPQCDHLPLCKQCKKDHPPSHVSYFIRFQVAIDKALKNLNTQIQKLQQYITPIERKRETLTAVKQQIDALQSQKKRLLKIIQDTINKEIAQLKTINGHIQQQQQKFYNELNSKLKSLENMKHNLQRQPKTLRQSLTLQIEHYLYNLGKNIPEFTSKLRQTGSANIAQLYTTTHHEMIISQLQLRKQILNPKLLKKMNNESPLYFLIDPKHQTGNYLHYFIPKQNSLQLRIYNVQRQKWTKHINQNTNAFYGLQDYCTIMDQQFNRGYLIGGKKYGRPVDDILWYDVKKNLWGRAKLKKPRSKAMITLIMKKLANQDQLKSMNYILIAGGFDTEGRAMKGWQLFDPQRNEIIYEGQMNFACGSGTLVTFNGDVVFKLGGLANKSSSSFGICPIVEKCDFSPLNTMTATDHFPFTYIQLQDISRQSSLSSDYQLYYSAQGAVQINPNEILVYGGQTPDNKPVSETYVINIEKFWIENYQKQKVERWRYYARWINEKPLITPMSFQIFAPCIWKNRLYSLQNLPSAEDQVYKGLIEFDMKSWFETENIVDDKIGSFSFLSKLFKQQY